MSEMVTDILFALMKREVQEPDTDEPKDVEQSEILSSWALFIQVSLVILALFCSYYLQLKKIQAVHETVVSIFAGMFVGLIIRATAGEYLQSLVKFDYQIFFNVLLPPIILNSGYELHQANFFRNIGSILTFAFAGTFISAWTLGIIIYIWSLTPFEALNITFVEAISVGATLSATDPVTILAIFNAYKVDPKLYTVIFGESILNDAVAIVMFETARQFHGAKEATIGSLFKGVGVFFVVFTASLLIGVFVGISTALLLKHTYIRRFPGIESCFILLVAYASYLFSNGCHMSGIVSLLFCGITLKHYAYYNMSRRTQLTTKYLFKVLAQLSENFIFIYLGLSLFTEAKLVFRPVLILVVTVGICIARWAAVFPLSSLINLVIRKRAQARGKTVAEELPHSYQAMLFWAGLRGAVGVALAAGFTGDNGNSLRATVLVVVVLTVIVFGGTTARMLEILGIRTGVMDEPDSDDEFDIESFGGRFYKSSANGFDGIGNTPAVALDDVGGGRGGYATGQQRPTPPSRSPSNPVLRNTSVGSSTTDLAENSDTESDASDLPPPARRTTFSMASTEVGSNGGMGLGETPPQQQLGGGGLSQWTGIFNVSGEDQAEWFRKLDEGFIKPTLLLDHDKGNGGPA
ncbi:Sodium/hydrogen exchanger family-domain-containing protein [Sphaerosporella brunnea]|uniref:Sodium/hydrogen exchanger n=1 Tax=Sphaerosporella brunnea TaxID=1250544 RepID=A0A5J5F2T8_9PEZI|nr:Sodium/hydrogen exchanger family-domain-containing protein [Sphaerosporella brunnea]